MFFIQTRIIHSPPVHHKAIWCDTIKLDKEDDADMNIIDKINDYWKAFCFSWNIFSYFVRISSSSNLRKHSFFLILLIQKRFVCVALFLLFCFLSCCCNLFLSHFCSWSFSFFVSHLFLFNSSLPSFHILQSSLDAVQSVPVFCIPDCPLPLTLL